MNLKNLIKELETETDKEKAAVASAEKLFSKPVEPVMIPNIAADSGGLHCISWDMSY